MLRLEAKSIFEKEFEQRWLFDLATEGAAYEDWLDTLMLYSIDIAKQAFSSCYKKSPKRPSIADFTTSAREIVLARTAPKVVKRYENVKTNVFVQLVGKGIDEKVILFKMGDFHRVCHNPDEVMTPEKITAKAQNWKKIMANNGGIWEVVDLRKDGLSERDVMDTMFRRKKEFRAKERMQRYDAGLAAASAAPSLPEEEWTEDEFEEEEFDKI